ncbi:MAG: phosphoribosylanthranilate isomerase [Pseudomonadota bacterium]
MKKVATKICGIDSPATAAQVVALGATAMGISLVPGSKRLRTLEEAAAIAAVPRRRTRLVLLFADAAPAAIEAACARLKPDLLQFHGSETPADCRRYGLPYLRAFRADGLDPERVRAEYADAAGWLVDAAHGGQFGGTGTTFDWSGFPQVAAEPWILAGGLNPENVGAAIEATRPCGVDVSSGVEGAQPGTKSAARIAAFMAAVGVATGRD